MGQLSAAMLALAVVAVANVGSAQQVSAPPTLEHLLVDRTATTAGGSLVHWYIDRRGVLRRQGVLMIFQGSGCASVTRNLNIAVVASTVRPHDAIIVIDKPGVLRGDNPGNPFETCSVEFWRESTISRRVADASRVLDAIAAEGWWNGRLTLWGGSEGGAVVAELAALRKETTEAVMMSSALGATFAEAIQESLPPEIRKAAPAKFAEIRRNPRSSERWGGNSYAWWADILDRDLTEDLLRSQAKLLIVQGQFDDHNPARSARLARARFAAAGRCNLTYLEYSGLGHQMRAASGESRLKPVMRDVENWLKRNDGPGRCARA